MTIKTISRNDLVEKLQNGNAPTLVEALPAKYFKKEHLPGAINIPHDEIEQRAGELLADKSASIVVYCASLACENSSLAAQTLVKMGYTDVADYAEGKEDWKEAGLELETAFVRSA